MIHTISIMSLPIIYYISRSLARFFSSERYYLSIPYMGSTLAILLYMSQSQPFDIPEIVERIFLSVFLFSIGYQTVPFLKKAFFYRSVGLVFLTMTLIASMELSSRFLDDPYRSLFGSVFFAYNKDVLLYTFDSRVVPFIEFWGSLQLILVFAVTPFFLLFAERVIKPVSSFLKEESAAFSVKDSGFLYVSLWLGMLVLILLADLLKDHFLFLYDYVFAMAAGGIVRVMERWSQMDTQKRARLIHQTGSLHLYVFIIITITEQFYSVTDDFHTYFQTNIFILILFKTVLMGVLSIYVVKKWQTSWDGSEMMVAAVAGWTFSLNAPVVCMHGMRTAVNKCGPAPLLFIIPPIILWLVNYIHLWLLAVLRI